MQELFIEEVSKLKIKRLAKNSYKLYVMKLRVTSQMAKNTARLQQNLSQSKTLTRRKNGRVQMTLKKGEEGKCL